MFLHPIIITRCTFTRVAFRRRRPHAVLWSTSLSRAVGGGAARRAASVARRRRRVQRAGPGPGGVGRGGERRVPLPAGVPLQPVVRRADGASRPAARRGVRAGRRARLQPAGDPRAPHAAHAAVVRAVHAPARGRPHVQPHHLPDVQHAGGGGGRGGWGGRGERPAAVRRRAPARPPRLPPIHLQHPRPGARRHPRPPPRQPVAFRPERGEPRVGRAPPAARAARRRRRGEAGRRRRRRGRGRRQRHVRRPTLAVAPPRVPHHRPAQRRRTRPRLRLRRDSSAAVLGWQRLGCHARSGARS